MVDATRYLDISFRTNTGKKPGSNSLEETRSREKVGRGLNFPVFPLVAIHDWTEKS